MASLDLKQILGGAVSLLSGGNAQVKVAAASVKVKSDLLAKAEKVGEKIGKYTGGNIFTAVAKGAEKADQNETERFLKDKAGLDLPALKTIAFVAGALVLGYFVFKD